MKHKSAKRFTAFLLSGAMLATGFAGAMPALHASAATELTTVSNGLKYRYIVKDSTSCVLKRVSDANNDWSLTTKSSLTIPDKIPGTNYVIKELGDQGQAIIHSNNANQTRVSSITLPKQVEKINNKALWDTEVPKLKNLYINLNTVKNCATEAFGANTIIENIYAYDTATNTYANAGTVTGFEKYYGLVNADYICSGDLFKLKNSSLNGKLLFLEAISVSPYAKQVGYKYAQKVAQQNGFTATNISKQDKVEMIYNYLLSHERYSVILDVNGNRMERLSNTSLSALGLNSGVCGSFAYAFEVLCRASGGFTITDNPSESDVVCVGVPGHAFNAVRMSASEGYYVVDCTAGRTTPVFMKQTTPNSQAWFYLYGTNTTPAQVSSNSISMPANQLASQPFASGHSYMKTINNAGDGLKVEVYDKNKTSCKFINYNAVIKPAVGTTCKLSQIADQGTLPQYISSYCYFGIKIGGVVIDTNKTTQTITVSGKKYLVRFETLNFGNGQPQVCSCQNYYQLTITPV